MSDAVTQGRWRRRLLLLAFGVGALWLVGLLGHGAAAHAEAQSPGTLSSGRSTASAILGKTAPAPVSPALRPVRTALPNALEPVSQQLEPVTRPVVQSLVQPVVTKVVQPVVTKVVQPVVTKVVQPVVTKVVQPVVTKVVQPVVTKVVQPVLGGLQPVLGSSNPVSPVLGSTNPTTPVLGSTTSTHPMTTHPAMHAAAAHASIAAHSVSAAAPSTTTSWVTASAPQILGAPALVQTAASSITSAAVVAHHPTPAPRPVPEPAPAATVTGGSATGAHEFSAGFDLTVGGFTATVAMRGQAVAGYSTTAPREQSYCPSVSPD